MPSPVRVLFVCYGNIIRSPLAACLFRKLAAEAGIADRVQADSAGTSEMDEGEPPDPRMRRVAAAHGLELTGDSRRFRLEDFETFDRILALDTYNRSVLRSRARTDGERSKIRLLRDFDPAAGPDRSVPDPIASGEEGFELTYQIVERSLHGLISDLRREGDAQRPDPTSRAEP